MSINLQIARLGGNKENIEVDLNMPCNELVQKVADKFELDKTTMKLLCKGKMLKHDETKTLAQLNIKNDDKLILMNKPTTKKDKASDQKESSDNKEEENKEAKGKESDQNVSSLDVHLDNATSRMERLEEIKKAAEKMAQRSNDGFDWSSRRYLELNNQFGERVHLPEKDRQALTMGLTLHEKGKVLQKKKQYEDALYVMQLAFESFSQADQQWLDIIDNYGLVCLDIVWLYYLRQDEKQISQAHQWLQIAEVGLKRSHGKNMERLKQLRGNGFMPELALYVRLNILKALQCFYQNDLQGAHNYVIKAETDWRKLQISDDDLVAMQNMGFSQKESTRALRLCQSNMDDAIQHVFAKRNETRQREEDEQKRLADRARARRYGKTKGDKFIDINMLDRIKETGIAEEIAVEALRQTDNHYERTMEQCFNVEKRALLMAKILQRSMRLNTIDVQSLQDMGFTEARARAALIAASKSLRHAVLYLTNPTTEQKDQVDRLEAEIVTYLSTLQLFQMQQEKEKELQKEKEKEKEKENKDEIQTEKTDNNNNDDSKMTENSTNNDNNNNNTDNNQNALENMSSERDIVEPMNLDSNTGAFPNPHLGDAILPPVDPNEENIPLTDDFADVTMQPEVDDHKEEEILDDLEDIDDPDAYLDLELNDEKQALEQLKTLLVSMPESL